MLELADTLIYHNCIAIQYIKPNIVTLYVMY